MSIRDRFKTWVRTLVVDSMKNSIQAMFYACDYSTKPNMVCAPLLVSLQSGMKRLEQALEEERVQERLEELAKETLDGAAASTIPEDAPVVPSQAAPHAVEPAPAAASAPHVEREGSLPASAPAVVRHEWAPIQWWSDELGASLAPDAQLHQFGLGDGTWRHRVEPLPWQCRSAAQC